MSAGQFSITLNNDGTVSIDSTKVKGSAASIMEELNSLAKSMGGDLVIEKHVHGAHAHQGIDEKQHTHN